MTSSRPSSTSQGLEWALMSMKKRTSSLPALVPNPGALLVPSKASFAMEIRRLKVELDRVEFKAEQRRPHNLKSPVAKTSGEATRTIRPRLLADEELLEGGAAGGAKQSGMTPEEEYGSIFNCIDVTGKGFLTPEDIEGFVTKLTREARAELGIGKWRDFLKEADIDGDGIVDIDEFILYFTKANLDMAAKNAELFFRKGAMDAALQMAEAAIKGDPTAMSPWITSYAAHVRKMMWKEASLDCNGMIELCSGHEAYWWMRAKAKVEMKDFYGAIEDCTEAIRLDFKSMRSYDVRARAQFGLKEYQKSIQDLSECLEREQSNSSYYSRRAEAKLLLGNAKGAIADCSDAIIFYRKNASAWTIRGLARYRRREYPGCVKDCTQALKADCRRPDSWFYRAQARAELEQWAEVIVDCEEAVRLNPDYQEAWALLGKARSTFNDFDGTIDGCNRAVDLDTNDGSSWYYGGRANFYKGNYNATIEECGLAMKHNEHEKKKAVSYIKKAERAIQLCGEWKPLPDVIRNRQILFGTGAEDVTALLAFEG